MKQIVLCADDYSQTPAISQGILKLLEAKRLSATTCMTNSPYWATHAQWLKPFIESADIGLHLNFTDGKPLTANAPFMPLAQLLIWAHLGKLNQQAITDELNAQIDQFIAATGKLPDFIDGHQHIHHLPLIRDVLLSVYKDRLQANGTYIRSVAYDSIPFPPCGGRSGIRESGAFSRGAGLAGAKPWRLSEARRTELRRWPVGPDGGYISWLKKLALQLTGARALKKELIKHKIPHNTSFSGIYTFENNVNYRKLFLGFLQEIQHGGLIMCHPGLISDDTANQKDPISQNRAIEFQYLSCDNFITDCQENGIKITQTACQTNNPADF